MIDYLVEVRRGGVHEMSSCISGLVNAIEFALEYVPDEFVASFNECVGDWRTKFVRGEDLVPGDSCKWWDYVGIERWDVKVWRPLEPTIAAPAVVPVVW